MEGQIKLNGKERLHCAACDKDFGNQLAYFTFFGTGGIVKEVLCEECHRTESFLGGDTITFPIQEFADLVCKLVDVGKGIREEGKHGVNSQGVNHNPR